MSSIESLITEADSEYWKLRTLIESKQTDSTDLSERETIGLFDKAVKFQRFLESKQAETKMFSGVSYYERASAKFSQILDLVTSQKGVATYSTHNDTAGLVTESKSIAEITREYGNAVDLRPSLGRW